MLVLRSRSCEHITNDLPTFSLQKRNLEIGPSERLLPVFGTKNRILKNGSCERALRSLELEPTYFSVSLVPIWLIFTPLSEFSPHLENFTAYLKSAANTIINVNANIFIGRKFYPLSLYSPKVIPPKVLARVIRVNSYFWGIFIFFF